MKEVVVTYLVFPPTLFWQNTLCSFSRSVLLVGIWKTSIYILPNLYHEKTDFFLSLIQVYPYNGSDSNQVLLPDTVRRRQCQVQWEDQRNWRSLSVSDSKDSLFIQNWRLPEGEPFQHWMVLGDMQCLLWKTIHIRLQISWSLSGIPLWVVQDIFSKEINTNVVVIGSVSNWMITISGEVFWDICTPGTLVYSNNACVSGARHVWQASCGF